LPYGDTFRNHSGLFSRSISVKTKSIPFSSSTILERCAKGHDWELIRFSGDQEARGQDDAPKCQGDVVRTQPRNAEMGVAVIISESAMGPA